MDALDLFFEVMGVDCNMKILQFSLVNMITEQILDALGPNYTMDVSQECLG